MQHPWSETVRVAIDLEAMGVGGKAHIFQVWNSFFIHVIVCSSQFHDHNHFIQPLPNNLCCMVFYKLSVLISCCL